MPGSHADDHDTVALRDLIALAMRCRAEADGGLRLAYAAAIEKLSEHSWSSEEHRVVYASLRSAGIAGPGRLRDDLAAQATRFGHPDVEWEWYF